MINKGNILMTFLGYPFFLVLFCVPPMLYMRRRVGFFFFGFPIFVMLFGQFIFLSRSRTEFAYNS